MSKSGELSADMELLNSIISQICDYPLSVIAEHIKNRLYEMALNEPEFIASAAIADMAEHIDFWVGELKDGDTE